MTEKKTEDRKDEIHISKELRCDQVKMLEMYFEAMKTDETVKKFLETIRDKISEKIDGSKPV